MFFYIKIFVLLCFSTYWVCAGEPDFAQIKKTYPNDDVVLLRNDQHFYIDYANEQWQLRTEVMQERMFMTETGAQNLANESISYSSFEHISELKALTLVPKQKGKKTVYRTVSVNNIETKDVVQSGIFFNDYQEKKWIFPSVSVGAITQMHYIHANSEPHFSTPFYFGSYYGSTVTAQYSVTVPNNIQVTSELLGEQTHTIEVSKQQKANLTTYTWTATNLPKIAYESDAPNPAYSQPHIVVYINNITASDGQRTAILNSPADLYGWYAALCHKLNTTSPLDSLQAQVQRLTQKQSTQRQKAAVIYRWVQDNVKYIAFEDGLGGFVPREAGDIFTKKYGDCKDMSNLIVTMLRQAGISAYLTWIGTRDRPYRYQNLPCPLVDNHMIAVAKIDGEYVFLDGTGEYQPFGLPTSMIQGKEALVGIDSTHYEIINVPIAPPDSNARIETLQLTINNRTLNGTGKCELSNYRKIFAEYASQQQLANGQKDYWNSFLSKGNNKCAITNVKTNQMGGASPKGSMSYQMSIPDYVQIVDDRIYINLNLLKPYKNAAIDTMKRRIARENEYAYRDRYQIDLQIPDDYALAYLPDAAQYKHNLFGFTVTYSQPSSQHVQMNIDLYLDFLILQPANFSVWNQFVAALNDTYQASVALKKNP